MRELNLSYKIAPTESLDVYHDHWETTVAYWR
jgi:hypothetical protein